jgi:signal transduction histidine kinase
MNTVPDAWQPALPVLDQLSTAVWLYHFSHQTIIWANQAALRLWDAPDLDALQQRDFRMNSESARLRLASYQAAFARQETLREVWTIYPRGRPVQICCHCAALDAANPGIMRVEASELDSDQATARSLEMLRHVREMVTLYDLHGHVLLRNPAATAYLPDAEDAFAANMVSQAMARELRTAVSESRSVRRIVDVQLADGSTTRHQMQLVQVPDPATGEAALLVSQHDVGDREKLLQLQRERSEELQSILDALPLPMVISELESGRIRYANRLAIELYGMWVGSSSELNPASPGLYDKPEDRHRLMDLLMLQGMVSDFQAVLRDRQQQRFDASLTGCLVDYRGVPSMLTSVLNISHIRERERSLEATLLHERELLEMQRRFVSMVSHEYRTPLAVIDGIAQRILRSPQQLSGEQLLARVQRMRDMVKHMVTLADSVLTLNRLESEQIHVEHTAVRLQPLLSELIELNQDIYPDCHIELDAQAEVALAVEGDAELLRLIFSNLINNAIKYSPRWQRVAIALWLEAGDSVKVSVRDWGVGVPLAEQGYMFTRFFRASTAQGIPGCGIGLALVKELVERHHGSIVLESSEGSGAIFTVTLPLHQPD